jgi:hypothetical protein
LTLVLHRLRRELRLLQVVRVLRRLHTAAPDGTARAVANSSIAL